MAAYTVDTLAIEISADSKDAAANIQGLADALANLKSSLRGSTNGMSKLAERLKEIRGAAIGTNQSVTRMSELLNAVTKLKDVKISKSIPDRIKELVTAMSTLKETDIKFSKDDAAAVRRLGGALEGIKGLSISKALPERFGELTKQIGSLTDDEIKKIEKLSMALEHLRGVDLKGFGSVMSETRRKAQEAKRAADEAAKMAKEKPRVDIDSEPVSRTSEKIKNLRRELNALQRKAHRITVKSTGLENAKSQIKELQRELKDVRNGKIHIDSGQLKETQERVIKIREELDKMSVKQKLQIDQSALSKLWSSIKRVAFYRAIRSLLKGITSSIKQGIENLYQYSLVVGTTFSNSMDRAASASLYFKNSLASMVAPVLESLVPILETVVDRIAALLDHMAQLFAALRGQSSYSKAVKTTAQFAEATGGAAKELQRFLAGFDELNVLNSHGGTSGGGITPDYSAMFEEAPIENRFKELAKKIKPILNTIGSVIEGIYKNIITPLFEFVLENLDVILPLVLGIAGAIAAWKLADSLIDNLKEADTLLGRIGKVVQGAVVLTLGAVLSYQAGYQLGEGQDTPATWIEGIAGLIASGIGGSLIASQIGLGAGPGFVIGVTIGVVFALKGYYEGVLDELINSTIFDGSGAVKISELADAFDRLVGRVIATNQPTLDAGNIINDVTENKIGPAVTKLNEIATAISNGVTTAQEKIPELVQAFQGLKDGTQTILDTVYNNIVRAVSGSLFDALQDAGVYVPQLLDVLAGVKGDVDKEFSGIQQSYSNLTKEYENGKISADQYTAGILGLSEKLRELSGYTDPVITSLQAVSNTLDGVNWEDKEATADAIQRITNTAKEARQNIYDTFSELERQIGIARKWSDDPQYQLALDQILTANEAEKNRQLNTIGTYLKGVFDQVQTAMVDDVQKVAENAKKKYDEMPWYEQIFAGTEAEFVQNAINRHVQTFIQPFSEEIERELSNFGVDGSSWAKDAIDKIADSMFFTADSGIFGMTIWEEEFNKSGQNIKGLFDDVTKDFEGYGRTLADAVSNGIDSESSQINKAYLNMFSGVTEVVQNVSNSVIGGINDTISEVKDALNSAKVTDGKMYYNKAKKISIVKPYATGGFPEDGLFFANHNELVGQFSNGRTAVANNKQIEGGIAMAVNSGNSVVVDALLTIADRIIRAIDDKDTSTYIDGRKITASQTRVARAYGR